MVIFNILEPRKTTKEGLREKQLMDLMLTKRKQRMKQASLIFRDKQFQKSYVKKVSKTKSFNKDLDFMKEYYIRLKKTSDNMFQERQPPDDFFS
jgi:hypothetical protein